MNPDPSPSSSRTDAPPRRGRGRPPRDPATPPGDPGVIGGRSAEVFSHAILDSLEAHLAVIENDGRIVAVNKAWERFVQDAAEDFPAAPRVGGNYLDALEDGKTFERQSRDEALAGLHEVIDRQRARFSLEYEMSFRGETRAFLLTVTPLLGVAGGAVVSHRETTDLRRARQETAEQHRMLEAVLESTADGVVVSDMGGTFQVFNRAAREIAGVGIVRGNPEDWSKDFGLFRPDRVTPFRLEEVPLYRAIRGESTDRVRMFLKNPTVPGGRFIEVSGRPWTTPDGRRRGGVVVFSDITDRVLAEEEWKLQVGVLDGIPLPILALDAEGKVIFWNAAAQQLTGWSAAELVGRRARDTLLDDSQRAGIDEIRGHVLAGRPYRGEFHVRRPDGTRATILATARAHRRSDGTLDGFVLAGVDYTAAGMTRDALHAREYELRQFQKMEAVGRLAGGVAHDFNNLLTVLRGFTDLLLGKVAPGDPLRGDVDQISGAVDRASELTAQLLAFGRRQPLEPTLLDPNAIVSEFMPMLGRTLGADIHVRVDLDPDAGLVRADATQLRQVILNVVLNARDAMPGGGELVLATQNVELDDSVPGGHAPLPPGAYVRLSISDTGHGIEPEVQPRVFEPFFTTKDVGEGTGLGLSTAYGIIRQLGGHIGLVSEPGRGTTFRIDLPRVFAAPGAAEPTAAAPPPVATGARTVLLVEDDAAVRAISRRLLERAGHRVVEAVDAGSALAAARDHAGAIDLVMCDLVLPGRSGPEVIAALREQRPDLRALLVSGHGREAAGRLGGAPDVVFLQKPFSAAQLEAAVVRVLGDEPPVPPR